MEELDVGLEPSYLANLAKSPKMALAELVWNAIDADATNITITIDASGLGAPLRLAVKDDGSGIAPDDRKQTFGVLGHSWKKLQKLSDGGRSIHGEKGEGRWAAFGIGDEVKWTSVADSTADGRVTFALTGAKNGLRVFRVSEIKPAAGMSTGVIVELAQIGPSAARYLDSDAVADDLLTTFALQIEQYNLNIVFRDKKIGVASLKLAETAVDLGVEGVDAQILMTVIEWSAALPRHLYLCDEQGITLHEMKPGIHAPGRHFSAYIKWNGFVEEASALPLEDSAPEPIPQIISAAQDALRHHFAALDEAKSSRLVKAWQDEDSYPFRQAPKTQADVAARGLFDIVAVSAAPVVERADPASRKFSLELLKTAVETDPSKVRHIMENVLKLPAAQVEEFSDLLQKTSLESVVKASSVVVGRLDFLIGLEEIVNDRELKKHILERKQLHRLLARETWIFREEYALTANDTTLRTALKAHIKLLGRDDLAPDEMHSPVVDAKGREVVVDLMLSGAIEQARNRREHVVVELKRPTVSIGKTQLDQIENYARAVAMDTRFASTDTTWEFWIVGDEIDPVIRHKFGQGNPDADVAEEYEENGYKVTVRGVTWAKIIQNARHRLRFVKDQLGYDPTSESGLDHLRMKHGAVLPSIILPSVEEGPPDDDPGSAPADNGEPAS